MKFSRIKAAAMAVLVTAFVVFASQVKAIEPLQTITIIANTAYGIDAQGNGAELCVITINDQTETYVAKCEELAVDVFKQLSRDYRLSIVNLTINGREYNKI